MTTLETRAGELVDTVMPWVAVLTPDDREAVARTVIKHVLEAAAQVCEAQTEGAGQFWRGGAGACRDDIRALAALVGAEGRKT